MKLELDLPDEAQAIIAKLQAEQPGRLEEEIRTFLNNNAVRKWREAASVKDQANKPVLIPAVTTRGN